MRQQKEIAREEEQRIRIDAKSVNQIVLERRDGFERCEIQVYPLLKSERDMSCCTCPFDRGVSIASRAKLPMIHIPIELPVSLEVMMEHLRCRLIMVSSNWKTLNLGLCLR